MAAAVNTARSTSTLSRMSLINSTLLSVIFLYSPLSSMRMYVSFNHNVIVHNCQQISTVDL